MSGHVTLGVTTSGPVAAAIVVGDVSYASASSQQALSGLLPCIAEALESARAKLADVNLVAVCVGPGSFTGLRIGVTLAKSIAQARALPIIGVSSYDIAEFESAPDAYPRAAIVEGKRDYYYARIMRAPETPPQFARGTAEELGAVLSGAERMSLSDVQPSERAVRAARLGRLLVSGGHDTDWRRISIDYGQRPNAVVNWEARRRSSERSQTKSAANLTPG